MIGTTKKGFPFLSEFGANQRRDCCCGATYLGPLGGVNGLLAPGAVLLVEAQDAAVKEASGRSVEDRDHGYAAVHAQTQQLPLQRNVDGAGGLYVCVCVCVCVCVVCLVSVRTCLCVF